MRKWYRNMAVGLTAALLLTGCGNTDTVATTSSDNGGQTTKAQEEEKETTEAEKEQVTLTALITQSRNYEGLQNMMKKLEEEENITIECQVIPDDQYSNIVKMRFNSGEAPDIIDMNFPAGLNIYDVEKFCMDLSNEPWVENMINPSNVTLNEKVYGFPFKQLQGVQGFIYNKTVFEDLGLTEPTNWEEFLAVCETIKTQSDIAPIGFPNEAWVPQILIVDNMTKALGQEGTQEFCEKLLKNEAKWNEVPEFAEAIDEYLRLFELGYVNEDYLSAKYDDVIAAVGEGRTAMCFNADFTASSIKTSYPDAQLGMFIVSMPVAANSDFATVNPNTPGLLVNKDTKHKEEVLKVLELWSTPEYADLYFEKAFGFPAFPDINGGERPEYLEKVSEQYVDTNKTFGTINNYIGAAEACTSNYLWLYYIDAPSKGMTGQEILDKFQKDYEQYMRESQQPGF